MNTTKSRVSRVVSLACLLLLFALAACGGPSAQPSPEQRVASSRFVSYAGAASRLDGLAGTEQEEQLRDWARIGLASLLEFDTAQLRDAFYDTVPVRDPAFTDLADQPTGPGRSLYDGRGVLHVLVPVDDPYEDRTIGLLIDDFRADAGADPAQVAVHRYQDYPETRTISLTWDDPAPTADVRAAHGYVERRVDTADGLTAFLAATQHLSLLERRSTENGTELWAGGWLWPDIPGPHLTYEDVSVIQRGYQPPPGATSYTLPGFSLDPGPLQTRDDLLALTPDLRPDLADRLLAGQFPADLAQTIGDALYFGDPPLESLPGLGLPSDRTQLWALRSLLRGSSSYRQARYDGRLKGTEVGMTLFYTDLIAKDWTSGVGSGVPTDAVEGFVPDPRAVIPFGHCQDAPSGESGRLWFGQSDAGFTFDDNGVVIGAQATRLFSRSGEIDAEIEPSYGFGQGLRWWDQHYQAIADYEPQYHRLEQIMRWSGAIEWLTSEPGGSLLPQLDDDEITSDLQFEDWYAAHDDLRERSPVVFVHPPSATDEALLNKPSEAYEPRSCLAGGNVIERQVFGGVSLADRGLRTGDQWSRPDIEPALARAGNVTSATDTATGAQRLETVNYNDAGQVAGSVTRTLPPLAEGRAAVFVSGSGVRVASFGGLKISRAQTATREFTLQLEADGGQISQRLEFQGLAVGTLATRKVDVATTTVQWQFGTLDRLRLALESVQRRLPSGGAGLPEPTAGVLYASDGPDGTVYRTGDAWFEITSELTPPGEELVLQGGGQAPPEGGGPSSFQGRQVPPPNPPGEFFTVRPGEPGRAVGVARGEGSVVRVETTDGQGTFAFSTGDQLTASVTDSVLGWSHTVEAGALMRDWARVQNVMRGEAVQKALRSAAHARDGLAGAVLLGRDGVAFAYLDATLGQVERVVLVGADHAWYERALRAINPAFPDQVQLFRLENGQAVHVNPTDRPPLPGSARRANYGETLDEGRTSDATWYFDSSLLVFEGGGIPWNNLPRERRVIVREVTPQDEAAQGTAWPPDVRVSGGREGYRLDFASVDGGSGGGGSGGGGGGGRGPGPIGPIFFVSLDCESPEEAGTEGCER